MRYGRHQIDKAGEIAISSTEEDVYKNAIEKSTIGVLFT